MLELDTRQIRMGQRAADKAEALHLLGAALVADGLAAPGYAEGLKAREAQGSTSARASPYPMGPRIPASGLQHRCAPAAIPRGSGLGRWPAGLPGHRHRGEVRRTPAAPAIAHPRLGEADLGPALSAAASAEEVLGLLQGAPQELALDAQLVGSARTPRTSTNWPGSARAC